MWTINKKQMDNISRSMRDEFEKRVHFHFSGKECTEKIPDKIIMQNIHRQTEYLIKYQIITESLAMEFIKLSFLHPVMREGDFSDILAELFEDTKDENEKIENLLIYLNKNNYVSEF